MEEGEESRIDFFLRVCNNGKFFLYEHCARDSELFQVIETKFNKDSSVATTTPGTVTVELLRSRLNQVHPAPIVVTPSILREEAVAAEGEDESPCIVFEEDGGLGVPVFARAPKHVKFDASVSVLQKEKKKRKRDILAGEQLEKEDKFIRDHSRDGDNDDNTTDQSTSFTDSSDSTISLSELNDSLALDKSTIHHALASHLKAAACEYNMVRSVVIKTREELAQFLLCLSEDDGNFPHWLRAPMTAHDALVSRDWEEMEKRCAQAIFPEKGVDTPFVKLPYKQALAFQATRIVPRSIWIKRQVRFGCDTHPQKLGLRDCVPASPQAQRAILHAFVIQKFSAEDVKADLLWLVETLRFILQSCHCDVFSHKECTSHQHQRPHANYLEFPRTLTLKQRILVQKLWQIHGEVRFFLSHPDHLTLRDEHLHRAFVLPFFIETNHTPVASTRSGYATIRILSDLPSTVKTDLRFGSFSRATSLGQVIYAQVLNVPMSDIFAMINRVVNVPGIRHPKLGVLTFSRGIDYEVFLDAAVFAFTPSFYHALRALDVSLRIQKIEHFRMYGTRMVKPGRRAPDAKRQKQEEKGLLCAEWLMQTYLRGDFHECTILMNTLRGLLSDADSELSFERREKKELMWPAAIELLGTDSWIHHLHPLLAELVTLESDFSWDRDLWGKDLSGMFSQRHTPQGIEAQKSERATKLYQLVCREQCLLRAIHSFLNPLDCVTIEIEVALRVLSGESAEYTKEHHLAVYTFLAVASQQIGERTLTSAQIMEVSSAPPAEQVVPQGAFWRFLLAWLLDKKVDFDDRRALFLNVRSGERSLHFRTIKGNADFTPPPPRTLPAEEDALFAREAVTSSESNKLLTRPLRIGKNREGLGIVWSLIQLVCTEDRINVTPLYNTEKFDTTIKYVAPPEWWPNRKLPRRLSTLERLLSAEHYCEKWNGGVANRLIVWHDCLTTRSREKEIIENQHDLQRVEDQRSILDCYRTTFFDQQGSSAWRSVRLDCTILRRILFHFASSKKARGIAALVCKAWNASLPVVPAKCMYCAKKPPVHPVLLCGHCKTTVTKCSECENLRRCVSCKIRAKPI